MANKEIVAMLNKLDVAINRMSDHNKKKIAKKNDLEDLDISSLNLSDEEKKKLFEESDSSSSITFDDDIPREERSVKNLRVVGRPALTESQRNIVQRRSVDVSRSFMRVDQNNSHAVALFWQEVEADLMEDEGLTNVGLRNVVYILRDTVEKAIIAKKAVTQMKSGSEAIGIKIESENGLVHKNDNRESIELQINGDDGANVEQEKIKDAEQKEEIKKTLAELRNAYNVDPLNNIQVEQHQLSVESENLYDSVHKKIGIFDATTESRAEKMGGRIHEVVKGFSKFYARFTPKLKRAIVASMVIGSILLSSVTNLHKDKEDYGVQNSHATVEQMNISPSNATVSNEKELEQLSIHEKANGGERAKNITSSIDVVDNAAEDSMSRSVEVVVEKNSSIISSLTKYLNSNPDLLKNTHKSAGQVAFILAHAYGNDHKSINLDKIYPGTKIDLDILQDNNGTNLHINNIALVGGPHLQPEQSKIKYDVSEKSTRTDDHNENVASSDKYEKLQAPDLQEQGGDISQGTFNLTPQMELQKVKEIMSDATLGQKFKQDVFSRIGDILGTASMQFSSEQEENIFIKRIALASVQDVKKMDLNPHIKKRVQDFLEHTDTKYGLNNDGIKFASYLSRVILREQMSIQKGRDLSQISA